MLLSSGSFSLGRNRFGVMVSVDEVDDEGACEGVNEKGRSITLSRDLLISELLRWSCWGLLGLLSLSWSWELVRMAAHSGGEMCIGSRSSELGLESAWIRVLPEYRVERCEAALNIEDWCWGTESMDGRWESEITDVAFDAPLFIVPDRLGRIASSSWDMRPDH
jgi:hypothetical protein